MLEPPHDDAWGNADTRRKIDYRRPCVILYVADEAMPLMWWDEHIRRESVRLPLLVAVRFGADQKDLTLAMEQNVPRLMEEAKPELVI